MSSSFETLLLDVDDGVAKLTLNRPELRNAFNEVMIAELAKAFQAIAKNDRVRVVLLTGMGEAFCAGADLNWMKKVAGYTPKQNAADAKKLHEMLLAVYRCPKPVLVHVNGPAIAGGLGLVAAADMAFAVEDAVFSFSEVRLGLVPAVISPFVIRKIGEAKAQEYFLTAERFSARQACEIGLINYAAIPDRLEDKIREKIDLLKQAAPDALAECKTLIRKVAGLSPEQAGAYTSGLIAKRRASPEGKEGILSFLTKRKPNWM
jgi:methylglutaconyl-CoA hydratase